MWRAIDLARRAELQAVCPNPRVGAVLVWQDRVIGEGYHRKCGEGHAEVNCLASVAPVDVPKIPDSTLYVTLEPCSHQGRTPSCARMLISRGIRRVVVGCLDPNPLVSGRGISLLRQSGIEVSAGCLEEECRQVARVFLTNQEQGRPYIILKWAESAVNKRCNKSAKKCCACLFVTHEYYFNFKNIEQSALLILSFDLITEVS